MTSGQSLIRMPSMPGTLRMLRHPEEIPLSAKSAGISLFSLALVLCLLSARIRWDR